MYYLLICESNEIRILCLMKVFWIRIYGDSSESDEVVSDAHSLELIECVDISFGVLVLVVGISDDGLR